MEHRFISRSLPRKPDPASLPESRGRMRDTVMAVSLVLVMLFTAAAWVTVARSRAQDQRSAQVTSENLARVLSESIDSSIREIDGQLSQLKDGLHDDAGLSLAERAKNPMLRSILAAGVRIADADGTIVAGPGMGQEAAITIADREFFVALASADAPDLHIGRPVHSRHSHTWVMPVARRLSNPDGSFGGVVFHSISLARFTDLFASIDIGTKGVVVLFDAQRNFVARHPMPDNPNDILGLKVGSQEFAAHFNTGKPQANYIASSTTDGIRRSYSYRKVGDYPLYVMVGLAETDYLAEWQEEAWITGGAVGLFVSVVAMGAYLILRGQRRQHEALLRLAEQEHELQHLVADLGRSGERYRQLLRTSSDGIHIIDAEGRLVEASDAFWRMLGYDQDDSRGLSIQDWDCHFSAETLHTEILPSLLARPAIFETRHRHRDGSEVAVEINARPVELDGKAYIYASSRDITERRALEVERRAAAADLAATSIRLRLVLDTAAEGIFGIDDESRITFANPTAAAIMGWSDTTNLIARKSSEVFGHRLADGKTCSSGVCSISQTLKDGQTRRVAAEYFISATGLTFPVEYVVSPVVVEGITVGAVVVFHDISERRALEDELQRSNTQLEQFAYVASHDLRQPLRMVSSYLTLLNRRLNDRLSEDERSFLGFAVGGAKRMDALILGLLEYSRIGRDAPHADVDMAEVVAEAVENLKIEIEDLHAELGVRPGLPHIWGNRLELMRLFQNLIGNALKYRAPERIPVIAIEAIAENDKWRITVRDNGIGIAPESRERVFGIFQRLVTDEYCEGTGIGLAICKKIVEGHGGQIAVEDNDGPGICMVITLPQPRSRLRQDGVSHTAE
ncbi:putative Sensor protein fixL [Candidatus Terasakiella magnetica]|nr:putative Sensor protein fixL [Candidatus Terasakiella magnetica]